MPLFLTIGLHLRARGTSTPSSPSCPCHSLLHVGLSQHLLPLLEEGLGLAQDLLQLLQVQQVLLQALLVGLELLDGVLIVFKLSLNNTPSGGVGVVICGGVGRVICGGVVMCEGVVICEGVVMCEGVVW